MGKLFGTNGVRGIANKELTPELALDLGRAMGTYWQEESGGTPLVLVGGDARTSTPMLKAAVTAGLQAVGCRVFDAGIAPTPALQLATGRGPYDGGVIVTASHNPPEFNGIKGTAGAGPELARSEEDEIETIYFEKTWKPVDWSRLHPVLSVSGIVDDYVEAVLTRVARDRIRERRFKVVIDCANGVGALAGPRVLRELGCSVVSLNAQLDGTFPGHPSEPTPENLSDLARMVTEAGADFGVAQDGDADRAIFVDETGAFVPGERVLAYVAGQIVKEKGGGLVVTPVSSSRCVEDYVATHGGKTRYTAVGSPVVSLAMREENAVFGGEENGGLIFPEHQMTRDSCLSIAKVLELLAKQKHPLSKLLAEVPQYAMVKKKTECPNSRKQTVLEKFAKTQKGAGTVDTTDGVKVTNERGWVLVRPSGTEPIFRVYAEAKDRDKAEKLAEEKLAELRGIIG